MTAKPVISSIWFNARNAGGHNTLEKQRKVWKQGSVNICQMSEETKTLPLANISIHQDTQHLTWKFWCWRKSIKKMLSIGKKGNIFTFKNLMWLGRGSMERNNSANCNLKKFRHTLYMDNCFYGSFWYATQTFLSNMLLLWLLSDEGSIKLLKYITDWILCKVNLKL